MLHTIGHSNLHHFHFCCYVLFRLFFKSIVLGNEENICLETNLMLFEEKDKYSAISNWWQPRLSWKTSWGHDRSEWRKSDREKLGMSGKSSGIVKNLGHHLPTKTRAKHSWRYMKIFLIFSPSIPGYLDHSDLRTHWSIHSKRQDRNFAIYFAPHMIYLVCIHIVSLWAA